MLTESVGFSEKAGFVMCVVAAAVVEIVGALTYTTPKAGKNSRVRTRDAARLPSLLKPRLWQGAVSIIVILLMIRVPSVTAAALLLRASGVPDRPENSQAAVQVLARAKAGEVEIGPATLEKAGKNFLGAAKEQPAAGDAALALANYRSSMNSSPVPLTQLNPDEDHWVPWNHNAPGPVPGQPWSTHILRGSNVPAASAAVFERIGQDLNVGRTVGPAFINFQFKGTSGGIGDSKMKHIILSDAVIYYGGSPIEMEDVYFVNCRFVVSLDNANGRNFVSAILKGNPVSFEAN